MADLLDELANLSLTDRTSAPQAAEEVALPDYVYKPLKDDGLFPLINLHPGSAYGDLMCTIYIEKLGRRDFTAVSYCWGSPERPHLMKCSDPKEIEIDSVVRLTSRASREPNRSDQNN
jgi:hypothetical protein